MCRVAVRIIFLAVPRRLQLRETILAEPPTLPVDRFTARQVKVDDTVSGPLWYCGSFGYASLQPVFSEARVEIAPLQLPRRLHRPHSATG